MLPGYIRVYDKLMSNNSTVASIRMLEGIHLCDVDLIVEHDMNRMESFFSCLILLSLHSKLQTNQCCTNKYCMLVLLIT